MTHFQLESKRYFPVDPHRVFEAWTTPSELKEWWGPPDVRCTYAEIDLRVGGGYRIANQMPDGSTLWIEGTYERIKAPSLLVFTWRVALGPNELVTVRIDPQGEGTLVSVHHERFKSSDVRERHMRGWEGCLDGLEGHFRR